jgi:hypothetical protein
MNLLLMLGLFSLFVLLLIQLGLSWSYSSWIYNYMCYQWLSPLTLWVGILLRQGVLDTLGNKVWEWLATGRLFSQGTPVSSINKTDCHDITEILLKVALNTINQIILLLIQLSNFNAIQFQCNAISMQELFPFQM